MITLPTPPWRLKQLLTTATTHSVLRGTDTSRNPRAAKPAVEIGQRIFSRRGAETQRGITDCGSGCLLNSGEAPTADGITGCVNNLEERFSAPLLLSASAPLREILQPESHRVSRAGRSVFPPIRTTH